MQQVSINSSPKVQANKPSEQTKIEKMKEKWEQIPDGDKKLAAGLSALAAVAIAGVAIMKGKNANKVITQITNDNKAAQTAGAAIEELAGKTNEALQTAGKKTQQEISDIAQKAKEEVVNGGDYKKIRKNSLRNLSHKNKKTVQEQIHQGVSEKKNLQKKRVDSNISKTKEVDNLTKETKKAGQGIKSATGAEELEARKQAATDAAKQAKQTAQELRENATTRKEVKFAKQAETKADEARLQAKRVESSADAKLDELKQKAQEKAKNVETLKSSPNYEAGLEKQEINAQKTDKNAINRAYKRQYDKVSKKYANTPKNSLLAMLNKNNLPEIDKQVITDILDKYTRS